MRGWSGELTLVIASYVGAFVVLFVFYYNRERRR